MKHLFPKTILVFTLLLSSVTLSCATTKSNAATQANVIEPASSQTSTDDSNRVEETTSSHTESVDIDDSKGVDSDNLPAVSEHEGTHIEQPETIVEPELTEIQKLAKDGNFAAARSLALENYKSGKSDNLNDFWTYFEADPLMTQTLDETVKPHGTNSLSALGGGSTVSLKYQDSEDESAKAAVKPDQDLRQTMYRSEIAYYRLCQVLGCSFDTPVTRPVRWSKADFNALYDTQNSKKNRNYSFKFEHLIWATENDTKYIYAAYKEWIPEFEPFPVAVSSARTLYLRPGTTSYPDLKTLFTNMLNGARPDSIRHLSKLLEYAGPLTTRQVLQQLSDLTLVDFLTNNWDRYSGEQNNYGANCHFQTGGIIAIDNGAAFPAWHAPRVVKRLHLIQTFSRSLVENLRLLDPDTLFDHLFPNPTKEEMRSRDRFKERRAEALKYIDDLIQKHGEDKILVF